MHVILRDQGQQDYENSWLAMQRMTTERDAETADEFWLLEHRPVYTLGLNGKPEHILNPGAVPVVQSDRGGQVTYHGPGQLIVYTLIDLKRKNLGVRALVTALENSIIDVLSQYGIQAAARAEAPGVYVNRAKIASLGLRIRRHCSYHGLSLNINMDLQPFHGINPCGQPGLSVTQLAALGGPSQPREVAVPLVQALASHLDYSTIQAPT